MKSRIVGFALFLLCHTTSAQPIIVPVWPHGEPGSIAEPSYRQDTVYTEKGAPRVQHVVHPSLSVYLPAGGGDGRAAVVICPGGGYIRLAIDHEGEEVAKWLNQMGAVGIVLTYRLPSDAIMKDKSVGPLQDVQEAIRIVRRRAKEWSVDPGKVGVMGFSAGGHLAGSASTLYGRHVYAVSDTTSARPDFSLLIYGVLSMRSGMTHGGSRRALLGEHPDSAQVDLFSAEMQVDERTPPAFLVHAVSDPVVPFLNSVAYLEALRRCSVPAELHLYEDGGHGFGLGRDGGTESGWPDACRRWMKQHTFIR